MKRENKTARRAITAMILAGMAAAALSGCGCSRGEQETSASYTEDPEDIDIPDGQGLETDYTTVEGLTAERGAYIAMVLKDLGNPYWKAVKEGAEKAVDDLNNLLGYTGDDKIRLTVDGVNGSEEENVDSQIDTIDAVLAENPSALCISVIDRESCTAQIEAAAESEIPVIILDSGLENGNVAAVCMTDNEKAAAEAADNLCKKIGERGQVAVFAHEATSQTSRERVNGFCKRVQTEYPQVEIVKVEYEEDQELPVEETLERYPELQGIFCTSATVVEKVLKQVGEAAGDEIQVAGFDANEEQLEAIREGRLLGTVCQNPRGMGYVSVVAAIRSINGQPADQRIDTGYVWLDQSNYEEEENQKYLYD